MAGTSRAVVVTGDVTMDWNFARRRLAGGPVWNPAERVHAAWQRDGAALLADLIGAVLAGGDQLAGGELTPPARAFPTDAPPLPANGALA